LVTVQVSAAGQTGFGYTYATSAAADMIRSMLAPRLRETDALDIPSLWLEMRNAIRNNGETGVAMMAVAAVDNALWDLKAKLLNVPLATLWGRARPKVEIYGSGGFTSYSPEQMQTQLGGWAADGIRHVKMKVGRHPADDAERVRFARRVIGRDVSLMVDANGGYSRKQALAMAETFAQDGVIWFEEPVHHQDHQGLRLIRDRAPAGMEISAGEYGYHITDFRRLLEDGAVDVLQADATRCGTTGFLEVAALCEAYRIPLSSHCAPYLHVPLGCAATQFRHIEYFHDHVRIEQRFMDGAAPPRQGCLKPDLSRPGNGLDLKMRDLEPYRIA
jgi:L-alanine-DL-glutamate epimerase-like enolase superfamily enzyme